MWVPGKRGRNPTSPTSLAPQSQRSRAPCCRVQAATDSCGWRPWPVRHPTLHAPTVRAVCRRACSYDVLEDCFIEPSGSGSGVDALQAPPPVARMKQVKQVQGHRIIF